MKVTTQNNTRTTGSQAQTKSQASNKPKQSDQPNAEPKQTEQQAPKRKPQNKKSARQATRTRSPSVESLDSMDLLETGLTSTNQIQIPTQNSFATLSGIYIFLWAVKCYLLEYVWHN